MNVPESVQRRKDKSICDEHKKQNKIKDQLAKNQQRQKQARILLRKVDCVLKNQGVGAALKELMKVRMEIPLTNITRVWLRDYRDMLDAWNSQIMPEVVDEFYAYGFRRARDLACKAMGLIKGDRKIHFYMVCEHVLEEMANRSRLAVTDIEETKPAPIPQTISLEDVSINEIQRGSKF